MKTTIWRLLTCIALLGFLVGGCSKKEKQEVDTTKLEQSFKSSEPATQATVDQVVSSIKAEDYGSATASLQNLASQAKLNPEQQKAVNDVLADLQKKFTETIDKAAEQGKKAIDDMKNALPKR